MGPNSIAFILDSWYVTLLLREHDDHTKHTETFLRHVAKKDLNFNY